MITNTIYFCVTITALDIETNGLVIYIRHTFMVERKLKAQKFIIGAGVILKFNEFVHH